jgi:DNA polymerase elongation subunit (family B)
MAFEDNRLLFGHDPEPRLLAVELSAPGAVDLLFRKPDGTLGCRTEALRPVIWTAGSVPVGEVEFSTLVGDLALGFLAVCDDWPAFIKLRSELKAAGMPHHAPGDPAHQYLLQSGKTLFKGLAFEDLCRMQLWVTTGESGSIEAVDLADNRDWAMTLTAAEEGGERPLLERLSATIHERDPDVIEGHDLFRSALNQIAGRARRVKLKLAWGRDGSLLSSRSSRLQIAEKTVGYPKFTAWGRHLVDTFVLALSWDVNARELEGTTLEEVSAHFHLKGEPVEQIRALAAMLGASDFIQAQIFPYSFQDAVLRGKATKIDALFLREYFRQGHSIPNPPEIRSFEGGYTDIFFTGVARDVWHCDVASLYPSVMLQYDCFPANDRLGIFRDLLHDLRQFRYEAKGRLRQSSDAGERHHLGALQAAFKVLINSFYGYLGFAQGHFADFDAASRVTQTGRNLLRQMVEWLRAQGAGVIEIDTDGIYFTPPPGATPEGLHAGLAATLPPGIEVDFDARYPAMFSYKAKNYALLTGEGDLILRGGALRSRGLEKFQRLFLERMLRALLEGTPEKFTALREEFEEGIRGRAWPIEWLMKTDTLQDSLAQYSRKIEASARNRSAAYELALRSGRSYQPGDQVSYYITGTRKTVAAYDNCRLVQDWTPAERDENVEYYVAKLNDLAKRFAEYFVPTPQQGELL